MDRKLLEILACPTCLGQLSSNAENIWTDDQIDEGSLSCDKCGSSYPIVRGIPRFVDDSNYASSFGYQWNRFRGEQIDSVNGTTLSARRFNSETGWTSEWLAGKWVLDAGCGAGRFLDVASTNSCEVVGVDISTAVDAARLTLTNRKNVHLVQASIYELPFRSGAFDACYSIGVIQHTPDPRLAVAALPRVLKSSGRIAVTIYERKPWTVLYPKYLLRPITKRLEKAKLLGLIKGSMPLLFPLTNVLFRIPGLGRVFTFAIPVANYVDEPQLSAKQRYDWAILDTFDMLSPEYDQPQTEAEVAEVLAARGIDEITRLPNPGVNLIGRKSTSVTK
jgi:SAM-dependent methyltransferase